MIGRSWLKLRQTFEHGIETAWYRDIVRPRILNSEPVVGLTDSKCEIHVFTSKDDFLNLNWAIKSFYAATNRRYPLVIHDDGSLKEQQIEQLAQHFPNARIIGRAEADSVVIPSLDEFPRCKAFRETNHLSPKLFDFKHFLNSDRMFLLDSDVLFFDEPTELLRRIEDSHYNMNTVNADVATAYTVKQEDVQERFGIELIDRFNSGLGLIHRDSIKLEWIEEFLGLPNVQSHFWRIEQTLFALCSCRYGVELLPQEYDVFLRGKLSGQPSRHYVGAVRHEMYREGIARLAKTNLLD